MEYIRVPKHWFSQPLLHAMQVAVRPPTKLTRRKQLVIKMAIPQEIFFDLMKSFNTGDLEGLEWDESGDTLKATSDRKTYTAFKYSVKSPSLVDKLWQLEKYDRKPTSKLKKKSQPFRRGHGCARLHLTRAAAERGELTNLIAQVTGNVMLCLRVPKRLRAMPKLTITFAVSSMDKTGHINWPTTYAPRTAAALRKQMRYHLSEMMKSAEYPTLDQMSLSLEHGGDSVLRLTYVLSKRICRMLIN